VTTKPPPTSPEDATSRSDGSASHDRQDRPNPEPKSAPERHTRKQQILTRGAASVVRSIADAVVIKDDEPFFLCPPSGQIDLDGSHGFGLYQHDTRFLSGYELRLAGTIPNPLGATASSGTRAVLELTNPRIDLGDGRTIETERLGLQWLRNLDGTKPALHDHISIRNYETADAQLTLGFAFASGFEDIFAIRGLLDERLGQLRDPRWDGDDLVLEYDGKDGVNRRLRVSFEPTAKQRDGARCTVTLDVPGRGEAHADVHLTIEEHVKPGAAPIERRTAGHPPRSEERAAKLEGGTRDLPWAGGDGWDAAARTNDLAFDAIVARSLGDLRILRGELDGQRYYAAGVPWFSTLFGRDALISSYQTLAFDARIAAETLRLLAGRQGTKVDDWRDEQPGKILHELRIGELARLDEIPQTPYYGSVDATPLFLLVLARHATWTGSLDVFHALHENVERALEWVDRYGDANGDGYVEYASTTKRGLVNQGWKDSGDAIVTADGSLASPPISLAEVQGYVYAAKLGLADLFERDGDADRASRLRTEAGSLRERFERDFWSDELGCYVLALGRDGKPCDVVSSNAGQVLWSGIASPDHARAVADRLLRNDTFSGWGIRTLSADAKAYRPIGYHLGTVWPHDNGIIAEGFRLAGLDDAAERVLVGLVAAATHFPYDRLPECFSGYDRETFGVPVRYPVACHPQAWAAGAIPHLLTTTLGLMPDGFAGRLRIVRPRLPAFVDHLDLRGVAVGNGRADIAFDRSGGTTSASVTHVDGDLDVRVEPG
jgi:glycogen debranching enzyme